MTYILGNDAYNIPNNLITVKELLNKFNLELLLPKRILELEIPNDFTLYNYYQEFDDLPESEKEYYYDSYIDDIEEGIIESMDDIYESFHRFEGEFHVIEIKEPPINFSIEDLHDDEDIGDFFLNMNNPDLAMSSCLFYYEYPTPNKEEIPIIIEYLWDGYVSPVQYN